MSYSMSFKLNKKFGLLLISTCIAAPIGYASEGSSKQVNDGILQEGQYSTRIMDVIKRELEANKRREYSDAEIVSILNFGARLMSPLSINDRQGGDRAVALRIVERDRIGCTEGRGEIDTRDLTTFI